MGRERDSKNRHRDRQVNKESKALVIESVTSHDPRCDRQVDEKFKLNWTTEVDINDNMNTAKQAI